MRENRGIFVNQPGKDFKKKNLQFDTSKPHMMAGVKRDPPHFDILIANNLTAIQSAPPSLKVTETLFTIPHKLDYTPEILVYFYCEVGTYGIYDFAGGYYADSFIIPSDIYCTDYVYGSADRTNVYIKHSIVTYSTGTPVQTSVGNTFRFRIKYYILSVNSGQVQYDTTYVS